MPRTTRKTTESSRVRLFVNFRPKAQTSIKISRQDLVDLYGDGHAKTLTTRTSFDDLLSVITEYVHEKNKEEGHFLEGYTFRQLAFPQVIFGRSEKYMKKEKSKDIQKLVSITSDKEWTDLCLRCESALTTRGKSYFIVELAVRVVKIVPRKQSSNKRNATSSSTTAAKKKKSLLSLPKKVEIEFFPPLKKDDIQNGVKPIGQSRSTLHIDISSHVQKKRGRGPLAMTGLESDSNSDEDEDEDNDEFDSRFFATLILSELRLDLIKQVRDVFSDEYGEGKSVLGKKSCLFYKEHWGANSWLLINNSNMLHSAIKKKALKKDRMKNGVLKMKLSFGHKKRDDEAIDDEYLEEEHQELICWSQYADNMSSPVLKVTGKQIRENGWNKIDSISKLLSRLYSDETSCLFEGFCNMHQQAFARLLTSEVGRVEKSTESRNDNPLLQALDSSSVLLTGEECKMYFLNAYNNSAAMQNSTHGHKPQKNQYPPTSTNDLEHCPPTYRAWIDSKKHQPVVSPVPIFAQRTMGFHQVSNHTAIHGNAVANLNTTSMIRNITFELKDQKCTVSLKGDLSMDSTILDVLKNGEDVQDLIGWEEQSRYRYTVLQIGNEKLYFGNSFSNQKVNKVRNYESVKIPLYIQLEESLINPR